VVTSDVAALGAVLAELIERVNDLSMLAGLPQLRTRTVVSIPTDGGE